MGEAPEPGAQGFAGGVFEHADPPVSKVEAAAIVRALYDVEAQATPLGGERDQNFAIVAATGETFVLKLSHSGEHPGLSDLQTAALLTLARVDPGLPVPRLVAMRGGEVQSTLTTSGGAIVTARLLTVVGGLPLGDAPAAARRPERIGAALARLDRALHLFRHPWEDHDLLWDLKKAARCRSLITHLEDRGARSLAERGLDLFEGVAAPALGGLRAQMIHNDFNPHNVFVDPQTGEVTGVIDLGDAVRAPLIQDVAVACAYQVTPGDDPLSSPAALVSGYRGASALDEAELAVLPALIAGRLAMSVCIAGWRAELHPSNKAYIVRNAASAVAALEALLQIDPFAAVDRLSAVGAPP